MASKQSEALSTLYKGWIDTLGKNPDLPIEDVRRLFEHWGDVTAEPRGVDYSEVDAGGVSRRARLGSPAIAATWPYVATQPFGIRRMTAQIAAAASSPWGGAILRSSRFGGIGSFRKFTRSL